MKNRFRSDDRDIFIPPQLEHFSPEEDSPDPEIIYYCPTCGSKLGEYARGHSTFTGNYCKDCGQRVVPYKEEVAEAAKKAYRVEQMPVFITTYAVCNECVDGESIAFGICGKCELCGRKFDEQGNLVDAGGTTDIDWE